MSKVVSVRDAAASIPDGAVLALGGNAIHRSPAAFARELARQGKRRLELVKTAGAYDVDLLALAGSVSAVHAGYVGFENLGFAANYRRGVEGGAIEAAEHACYSVIAGLRAAASGVPFLPIAGFQGSSAPEARGWKWVDDPYGAGRVLAIPALRPDFAVLHVHEADETGNAHIEGPVFEDVLMSRAARSVIVTAERIVPRLTFRERPERAQIPGFLVSAVVEAKGGALPGSSLPEYDADLEAINRYLSLEPSGLAAHLEETSHGR